MSALNQVRYQHLVDFLRSKAYPPGFTTNEKQALRQQAATMVEKHGVLYYSRVDQPLRRIIVDRAEKIRLMSAFHDGIDGGHFGRDKTLSKVAFMVLLTIIKICVYFVQITASYWWNGMANDVSDYCKKCHTCQHVNNRLGRAKAELHPIPVARVWNQIGIDLKGT